VEFSAPDDWLLKERPSDFLVRESVVLPLSDDRTAGQHYLLLRKSGYTTMEAVRIVAGELGVPVSDVTYGGLKDEDAITEQIIAVPAGAAGDRVAGGDWGLAARPGRWLHLRHYGYGATPMRIGGLTGNDFRIVVRNLPEEVAKRFAALRKYNLLFLNYYDTQRFGVPGGPRRTHLVGRALLAERWSEARRELIGLGAPESATAAAWDGPEPEFWTRLDARTVAFYLASAASFEWNAELRTALADAGGHDWFDTRVDGLEYRYARSAAGVAELLRTQRDLDYLKYRFESGRPVATTSSRPTVVQALVEVAGVGPDTARPGRFSTTLGFFLPSGSYATAAVRQLVAQVEAD
jgi:tRNA pseudouridine13 synthase